MLVLAFGVDKKELSSFVLMLVPQPPYYSRNKSLMNETDAQLVIWDNEQFNPFLYVTFTNELYIYDFDFSY